MAVTFLGRGRRLEPSTVRSDLFGLVDSEYWAPCLRSLLKSSFLEPVDDPLEGLRIGVEFAKILAKESIFWRTKVFLSRQNN